MTIRTYSEMIRVRSFEDRFDYLNLHGEVGRETFGFDRWLNQAFYRSREWRSLRSFVIARDEGCDLAVPGYEIHDRVYIHHMNPMTKDQLIQGDEDVLDPEFLVLVSHRTHNAIHFGDRSLLPQDYVPRRPGDTKLW